MGFALQRLKGFNEEAFVVVLVVKNKAERDTFRCSVPFFQLNLTSMYILRTKSMNVPLSL